MSVLARILEHKRRELEEAQRNLPMEQLEAMVADAPPVRSFAQALKRPDGCVAVIAEVKKASPSKGVIREDFDPVQIALTYAQNGASAISVLTEERFFAGSLDYLRAIRAKVSIPILRKDFLISRYQVLEARVAGADAVLLIVAALHDEELKDLLRYARELRMEALVEVHTQEELRRALRAGAAIVGINNRDLTTFHTSLEVTEQLAPLVPSDCVCVSESGIVEPEDILRVARAGAHAVLVGESLMRAEDIGWKLRSLVSAVR